MICTFQVYVSGEPIKKFFKVANRTALWTQYNNWALKRGGIRIEDDRYMGSIAWDIPEGVAEVREIVEVREII
jgi:hypothetical protein